MRFSIFFLVCYLTVAFGHTNSLPVEARHEGPHGASGVDQLVGAWRLVSVETRRPNGEVIYPFYGSRPEGLLVRGLPDGLNDRTIATLKTWRCNPALKDGKPVPTRVQFVVNFSFRPN